VTIAWILAGDIFNTFARFGGVMSCIVIVCSLDFAFTESLAHGIDALQSGGYVYMIFHLFSTFSTSPHRHSIRQF
jgi:hypothetical protein